jgi:hypothetical protein
VLWPAESIYEGTWNSGPPPQELMDFEVMREMKWTFAELEATPLYVRRYVQDFIVARRNAQREAEEKANRKANQGR